MSAQITGQTTVFSIQATITIKAIKINKKAQLWH